MMRTFMLALALLIPFPAKAEDVAVFMYHRFGEDRFPSTSIRMEQFRPQLEHLRDGGYTIVSLAQVIRFLEAGTPLPPRAVALTVDDAYLSVYEEGWPLFREYGFPFTVFVSTEPVDRDFSGYMSWDQMREMASAGVGFANHGAGHLFMVQRQEGESEDLWKLRIAGDVEHAQQRLDTELGAMGTVLEGVFAWPYGEYDSGSAEVIQQLGYIAFGQQSGAIGAISDRRALPRFPINEAFADITEFATKATSLAMPVKRIEPWDPVTGREPELRIFLTEALARPESLACFVSRQGRVEVEWLEPGRAFLVKPREWLGRGRQRVNCTAPAGNGRFYWYSHQWIVQ
jgi:peptidoglycan/xylan/chitin deacetylase (PgdA/CDA1 family)